ncbi:MAG: 4Fe-4S binding protein [bacterium]
MTGSWTILVGMWVTLRHLFLPTVTVQYPRERLVMFPRTRAKLVNHVDECGYCLACQRICPAHIFTIKGVRAGPEENLGFLPDGKPKKIHVVQFDIDMSKCLYCGLCVEACETKSLRWEQPVEEVTESRQDLYKKFSHYTPDQVVELMRREEERKRAKAEEGAKKPSKAETVD